MAKHYTVTIKVAYDEAHPIPADITIQLEDNVRRCVENAELLNDVGLEAVVEDWGVEAEENVK